MPLLSSDSESSHPLPLQEVEVVEEFPLPPQEVEAVVEAEEVPLEDHHTPMEDWRETPPSNSPATEKEASFYAGLSNLPQNEPQCGCYDQPIPTHHDLPLLHQRTTH